MRQNGGKCDETGTHLRFELEDGSLVAWKRFFTSGVLHCPSPEERPDVFVIDEDNVGFLETNMKNENEKNWYAHYHLGLGYYAESEYEKAEKEFLKSLETEKIRGHIMLLHVPVCSTPRLMFYYICALHGLGKDEQAFSLLEKDGGLEMPDIREGEESIARLWKELYESLYGEAGEIPYKYAFRAF